MDWKEMRALKNGDIITDGNVTMYIARNASTKKYICAKWAIVHNGKSWIQRDLTAWHLRKMKHIGSLSGIGGALDALAEYIEGDPFRSDVRQNSPAKTAQCARLARGEAGEQ